MDTVSMAMSPRMLDPRVASKEIWNREEIKLAKGKSVLY
jgi:hypothetical protein